MKFQEVVPIEKSAPDHEIARMAQDFPVNNDGDIIQPLQILLATRRGMRTDPSLATLEIPRDQAIVFSGPSGVEAVKGPPIWAQVVDLLGYMHVAQKALITFLLFGFTKSFVKDVIDRRNIRNAGENLPLRIAGYITAAWVTSLILARIHVKRNMAASMPPSFNPQSYEYRLVRAIQRSGMSHRGVVARSPKEMEGIWSGNLNVREIFQIEGLVDPESPEWSYDIVVKFFGDGRVEMHFSGLGDQNGVLTRAKHQILFKGRTERFKL